MREISWYIIRRSLQPNFSCVDSTCWREWVRKITPGSKHDIIAFRKCLRPYVESDVRVSVTAASFLKFK
ncbi:hypothetical protein IQ06DRAFT_139922 [Phaeosphaeriaceae sp. SRC1lsM3a]|nr:hypothetical protein IQ06DRAFT_139922 [Stagonospora sp. SRC1lsM3a]